MAYRQILFDNRLEIACSITSFFKSIHLFRSILVDLSSTFDSLPAINEAGKAGRKNPALYLLSASITKPIESTFSQNVLTTSTSAYLVFRVVAVCLKRTKSFVIL